MNAKRPGASLHPGLATRGRVQCSTTSFVQAWAGAVTNAQEPMPRQRSALVSVVAFMRLLGLG